MFKLVPIEDTILTPPRMFGYPRLAALEWAINKRLSDKIIPGAGLCIALWDFLDVGEDSLQILTGESATKCKFRMVVFAPFEGEVVFSHVKGSCEDGLFMDMKFFDALMIPRNKLPAPNKYDDEERVWIWMPENDGEETEENASQELYMDATNESVFRVIEVVYDDQRHVAPKERDTQNRQPMSIVGSLFDTEVEVSQGLGDPLWWQEDYGEEEEEADFQEGDGEGYEDDGEQNGADEVVDMKMENEEAR